MASSYSDNLRLELQATGENDGTWGTKANTVFDLIEDAISEETSVSTTGGDTTLTTNNGSTDQARAMFLDISGTLSSDANIIIPAVNKLYAVRNGTSGSFDVNFKVSGQTAVAVTQGRTAFIYCDGTNTFLIGSEGVTITSTAASILDDTSTGAILTTLGVTAFAQTILDDADASTARATLGLAIGSDVQAYDADTLKADTTDVLTAGFEGSIYDNGTKSSGTLTPDEDNGNFQKVVNGGAFTLAVPSTTNGTTIVLQVTNNGSAGAITTSGYDTVTGDTISTTNGDDFLFYITKHGSFSHLHVTALQ